MTKSECPFCGRQFSNPGGAAAHAKFYCSQNPDKAAVMAGAKKGCKIWNKGKKIGRNPMWDAKFPMEKVCVENSTYPRHSLKKRLIEQKIIPYECQICGIGPEWQGKPMPLILDHINGVNNDNRLSNLRFVCSNCDSQLETYKAKNKKPVDQ